MFDGIWNGEYNTKVLMAKPCKTIASMSVVWVMRHMTVMTYLQWALRD